MRVKNETSDPLKGYELLEKISNPTTIPSVKETSKRIERLLPGRFYEVTVFAKNGVGVSLGGTKIIRTKVGKLQFFCVCFFTFCTMFSLHVQGDFFSLPFVSKSTCGL